MNYPNYIHMKNSNPAIIKLISSALLMILINVLADPDKHYVIQLLGGNQGDKLGLVVPSGRWRVEWIDPDTGTELKKYEIDIDSGTMELEISGERDHRIIYLSRV